MLTSLSENREFLHILRKADAALVLGKQWSTEVPGDFLGMLYLQHVDDEVKAINS